MFSSSERSGAERVEKPILSKIEGLLDSSSASADSSLEENLHLLLRHEVQVNVINDLPSFSPAMECEFVPWNAM